MLIVVDGQMLELASGKDALINGMNTLNIEPGDNIVITQDGTTLTISSPNVDLSWSNITGKPDVALKSDIVNVYKYKGSVVAYADLPTEDNEAGDVYNVEVTGMNYAWTGTGWDALGEVFQIDTITDSEIDAMFENEDNENSEVG